MYLKSDVLLLADVFENFRKMCLKISDRSYKIDPAKFLSPAGLAWQAALKNTEVKLELLTDIDTLFIVLEELEEGHVMQFIGMQKLIRNIWKIMIKIT